MQALPAPTSEPRTLRPMAITPRRIIAPALLARTAEQLEGRLAAAPRDPQAWRALGDLHRRRGDFAAALQAYRTLGNLEGNAMARWLVAVAGGEELPDAPQGVCPLPFVHMTKFFTPAQRERVLRLIRERPEAFGNAEVLVDGKGAVNPETRASMRAYRKATAEVRRWFMPKLRRLLPRVLDRLQIELSPSSFEMTVNAYGDGGFFTAHNDATPLPNGCVRLVSYVCFVHEEPRGFDGGELLLYDSCRESRQWSRASFSRIDPIGNSAIFFPSDGYHEVLRVNCGSDAMADWRCTVSGHCRRPVGDAVAPTDSVES